MDYIRVGGTQKDERVKERDKKSENENTKLTRIDGEKQAAALFCELLVQVLPADARLHNDVHVVSVELDNLVHKCKVDADAAVRGGKVALQARPTRVRNNGDLVLVAYPGQDGHVPSRPRIRHSNRKAIRISRRPLRVTMRPQVLGVGGNDVVMAESLPNLFQSLHGKKRKKPNC